MKLLLIFFYDIHRLKMINTGLGCLACSVHSKSSVAVCLRLLPCWNTQQCPNTNHLALGLISNTCLMMCGIPEQQGEDDGVKSHSQTVISPANIYSINTDTFSSTYQNFFINNVVNYVDYLLVQQSVCFLSVDLYCFGEFLILYQSINPLISIIKFKFLMKMNIKC